MKHTHGWRCMVRDVTTFVLLFAPLILYAVGVRP